MAQTVSVATGELQFTVTAGQTTQVNLPFWCRRINVEAKSVADIEVSEDGTDAGAAPSHSAKVTIGQLYSVQLSPRKTRDPSASRTIFIYSAGAAVVFVKAERS
jgi:hypothetical protein